MKTDVMMGLSRSEAELLDEVLSDVTSQRHRSDGGHDPLSTRALDLLPVLDRLRRAVREAA